MNNFWRETIQEFKESNSSMIAVTLVHTKGSAPQEIGAKILIGKEGLLAGTIGGGKVELKVIAHAQEMLKTGSLYDFQEWNLQTDVGMTCGGVCVFYFEKIGNDSKWKIAVFGAGHVAQELVRTLIRLDCLVTCIDSRQDWLEKFPEHDRLTKIYLQHPAEAIKTLPPETFIISMTMGHAYDLPILTEAFKREVFTYIGAIGSLQKAKVLVRDLKANGISENALKALYCPIGEEFGNNTPCEIAISITAQLMKVRDQLWPITSTKI